MQQKVRVVLVVFLLGLGLGSAGAQSTVALETGVRVMQHRARNTVTEFADIGLIGQPVGASLYLGSRYGVLLGAELVRPYLAWVDSELLESGSAQYGFGFSAGLGTRRNFSDRRFLLAGLGIAASGLSLNHGYDIRSAYSNWGPAAQAALYFRTRHNVYAFAGAEFSYHPDFNPVGNPRYKSGFSGGINVGVAAAAQPRKRYGVER